ncbi:MAG: hypothetical protein L0K12_12000 [Brevibacterium aurantiacum]|nr:hypothetical protein [Brevibacterium aurantiacum]
MTTRFTAASTVLAGAALLLSGCSPFGMDPGEPQAPASSSDSVMAEACQVMVTELETAGYSFANLVPTNLSEIDGAQMADVYVIGSQALERSRRHVDDVKVGDIIDSTSAAMSTLAPIIEKASTGDPSAIAEAREPLGVLASTAERCSTVVTL